MRNFMGAGPGLYPRLVCVLLLTHAATAPAQPETAFPATVDLSSLDGSNGFVLEGDAARGPSELNVSAVGDINADGFDDIIVGAPDAGPDGQSGPGRSYVIFGSSDGFAARIALSDLDGSNGFALDGTDGSDRAGASVAAAGDVNNDNIDDLIIGAPFASPDNKRLSGRSFVVFGRNTSFPAVLPLSSLKGDNGFIVNGIEADDFAGVSVAGAGDVNGDDIDDVIVGANGVELNGLFNVGQGYVIFGSRSAFSGGVVELSSLDGSNGFTLNGIGLDAFDNTGLSVSAAGDVNDDGIDDLLIGAPSANVDRDSTAGRSYVVFGTRDGFPAVLELDSLDGSNGFAIAGTADGDFSGKSVAFAGDVNGDDIADIVVGADGASPNGVTRAGLAAIVFGTGDGFPQLVELGALDGTDGFLVNGLAEGDAAGTSVSWGGDINDDGFDDLLVGAPLGSPDAQTLFRAGQIYVVYGSDEAFLAELDASSLDATNGFMMNGNVALGRTGSGVSQAGDVNGDQMSDIVVGAQFSDAVDPDNNAVSNAYVLFGRRAAPPPPPPPGRFKTLYLAPRGSGTAGGVGFRDEDIIAYDAQTESWSMFFNGSEVGMGLTGSDLSGFAIEDDGNILMTFKTPLEVPGLGTVDDSDIVRFKPTSTGATTAGTFEMYFDGSDVGLTENNEDIDAIALLPDGRLVISLNGSFSIGSDGGTGGAEITEVIVDQRDPALGGQWNLLGRYRFDAGGAHSIEVSSENGQASADAVRLMPVAGGDEIIVDDQDSNTSRNGGWFVSSGTDPWEGRSLFSHSNATFSWLPDIQANGEYDVFAWWTSLSGRSQTVPYRIAHAGGVTTPTLTGRDEDLLIFTATTLGDSTSGSFEKLESGQASLRDESEDINGAWIDANADVYFSTMGNFSIGGVSGDAADVAACITPTSGSGPCVYELVFDGSANGFEDAIDAVHIVR